MTNTIMLKPKRINPEDLKVDLSDWSLNTTDEFAGKVAEIFGEQASRIFRKIILQAASEALEIAFQDEGIFFYTSSDDDHVPTLMVSIPISSSDAILFEINPFELAELHRGDETAKDFANSLRYIADILDPPKQ